MLSQLFEVHASAGREWPSESSAGLLAVLLCVGPGSSDRYLDLMCKKTVITPDSNITAIKLYVSKVMYAKFLIMRHTGKEENTHFKIYAYMLCTLGGQRHILSISIERRVIQYVISSQVVIQLRRE